MDEQATAVGDEKQALDPIEIRARLYRLNERRRSKLTQQKLAKRLGCSQALVFMAMDGKRPELLERIERHIARLEKEIESRTSTEMTSESHD